MDEREFEIDLQLVARRLGHLGQQVGIDVRHKGRLREELLVRHAEMTAQPRRWRFPTLSLRRASSFTVPAVAVAAVLALLLPDIHPGGRTLPGTAEAARIAMAAARSVPTVTSWRFTVHRVKGDTTASTSCFVPLGQGERLYTRNGSIYLFEKGSWYQVNAARTGSCARWQYTSLSLPTALPHKHVTIRKAASLAGRPVEEVSYSGNRQGVTVTVHAWVSPQTGLVVRLERLVTKNGRVVEKEMADYSYHQSSP